MSSAMNISPEGIEFIKRHESLKLSAYRCPADKLTIGYGHVLLPFESFRTITREQAEDILEADLSRFVRDVNCLVEWQLAQHQFDALVSFAFNAGSDIDADTIAEGLGDSTLLRKVNELDFAGAAEEFDKWVYGRDPVTGRKQVLPGLVKRRKQERAMFERGVYA